MKPLGLGSAPLTVEPGSGCQCQAGPLPSASGFTPVLEGVKAWLWVREVIQYVRTISPFHPPPCDVLRMLITN